MADPAKDFFDKRISPLKLQYGARWFRRNLTCETQVTTPRWMPRSRQMRRWTCLRKRLRDPSGAGQGTRLRQRAVPCIRRLRRAHAGLAVHRGEAEFRCEAGIPFPVVDDGPDEITADRRAFFHRKLHRLEMFGEIVDAEFVVEQCRTVAERIGAAVLRDEKAWIAVIVAQAREHFTQTAWVDLASERIERNTFRRCAGTD